jgi:hypothetical protein
MQEISSCGNVWKLESHTIVYSSLPSTIAVSSVLRIDAHFVQMPWESTKRCAYIDCKKTTDKRSFGVVRQLKDDESTLYSTLLRSQHDGVVCNCHYTSLRR